MNIDLRNISDDFEKEVNKVKTQFDINTNSKAVEYCVKNYMSKCKRIQELENYLAKERLELSELKKDVKTLTGVLSRLNQIT